jgi:predicted PurR-regulated permease PerM
MVKQWSVQTRYLVLIILLLLLAVLIYFARALISPLVVAALLAYVLEPGVSLLVRQTRLSRRASVVFTYLSFLILLISVPAILAPVMLAQIDDIRMELANIETTLNELLTRANLLGIPLLPNMEEGEIQDFFSILYEPERIFGILLAATENLAWILIIFVTTFYFLLDGDRLRDWTFNLFPAPYDDDVRRLHDQIRNIWQAYLRGQLLLMFIIGLLTWFMGVAVGLRGALLIGIVAGALDVIPSLGPAVAMLIAAVVAFFEGSSYLPISRLWFSLLVVGLFIGIQAFENVWLRPRILSERLRLHPAVVFVAIVGALSLAGVVAALVIVPLISTVQILSRYLLRRVFGLEPWLEPEPESPTRAPESISKPIHQEASSFQADPTRNAVIEESKTPTKPA